MLQFAAQHSCTTTPVQLDLVQTGSDRFSCAVVSLESSKLIVFSWTVARGEVVGLSRSVFDLEEPCVSVTHVLRTSSNDAEAAAKPHFLISLRSGRVQQLAVTDEDDGGASDDAVDEALRPDRNLRLMAQRCTEPAPWDSAVALYGQQHHVAAALVAPPTGADGVGVSTIRVLQLQHDGHLRPVRSCRVAVGGDGIGQPVGGIGSEPLVKLQPVVGDSNSVMALCQRFVLQLDLRAPAAAAAIVDALPWQCHDPLQSFCPRDMYVFAGTASGRVLAWDVRRAGQPVVALEAAASTSGAVVGMHAFTPATFVTAGGDGVVQQWDRLSRSEDGGQLRFSAARVDPAASHLPFGSVPLVDMAVQAGVVCTIDATGVMAIYLRE
jgi:hypothetical protein